MRHESRCELQIGQEMPPLPGGFDFNRIYVKSFINQTPSGGWLYELGVKGPIENGWYTPDRSKEKDQLELYYRDWEPVADIYCWAYQWYARDRTKVNKEMTATVIGVWIGDSEDKIERDAAKWAVELIFDEEDEMERSRR